MPVHYSPATLSGAGWAIESLVNGSAARIVATTHGHRLTGAGLRAVTAQANTYLQSLSAAQVTALLAVQGDPVVRVDSGAVSYPVLPADIATQAAVLAGLLSTAANTGAA